MCLYYVSLDRVVIIFQHKARTLPAENTILQEPLKIKQHLKMLMTLLYMFVTLVQSRQRSSLKAKLKKIFNERQYSVLFCTESQSELKKLDDGREYDGYNRSSRGINYKYNYII